MNTRSGRVLGSSIDSQPTEKREKRKSTKLQMLPHRKKFRSDDVHRVEVTSCKLHYKPSSNPDDAIITIDGEEIELSIHNATNSRPDGTTPRHVPTKSFHEKIKATEIDPKYPIQRLHFPNGNTAAVVLAMEDSIDPDIQRLHQIYRSNKGKLGDSLGRVPPSLWHVDDLAGGSYLAVGFGSTPPGPKNMQKRRWRAPGGKKRHQIPFLRRTVTHPGVQECLRIAAQAQGAAAKVISKFFPDMYLLNENMGEGAADVSCPPVHLQEKQAGKSWFANQFIYRCIGVGSPGRFKSIRNQKIALHVDESDGPGYQLLQYWPMGGANGQGGPIVGTDFMAFEHRNGGVCARIPTTIANGVVLIVFDGSKQLHCTDCEEERKMTCKGQPCWSARLIPYFRGPIMDFVEDGRKYGSRPKSFVDLRRVNGHWPLDNDALQHGQKVTAMSEKCDAKKSGGLYEATVVRVDDSRDFKLHWTECGLFSSGKWTKRFVFDVDCAFGKCKCTDITPYQEFLVLNVDDCGASDGSQVDDEHDNTDGDDMSDASKAGPTDPIVSDKDSRDDQGTDSPAEMGMKDRNGSDETGAHDTTGEAGANVDAPVAHGYNLRGDRAHSYKLRHGRTSQSPKLRALNSAM